MANVNQKKGAWPPVKRVLRAVNFGHCVKAGLLALLGLLNTYMLVGMGRFQQNLVFVPFIYGCVAIAGMLSVHVVHNKSDPDYDLTTIARIACTVAIGVCIVLSTWYGITIEQELPAIAFTAVFCSAWVIISVMLTKFNREAWTRIALTTSTYSGGLLFAMLLNAFEVPLHSCFVIAGFFFLILGRELVKDSIMQKARDGDIAPSLSHHGFKGHVLSRSRSRTDSSQQPGSQSPATSSSPATVLGVWKSLRLSMYIFMAGIGCLIIPIFTGVWNYAFYSYLVVPACLVLCVVSHRLNGKVLTINQLDKLLKNVRAAFVLIVIGLVLQFVI